MKNIFRSQHMSEYQRFISYMYEYQNGQKSANCGYARIERRGQQCRLEIHMKTAPQTEERPIRIYGCFQEDGILYGLRLGQHTPVLGMLNWRYQGDAMHLSDSPVSLNRLEGLILSDGSQTSYGSMWNDGKINPQEMKEYSPRQSDAPDAAPSINHGTASSDMEKPSGSPAADATAENSSARMDKSSASVTADFPEENTPAGMANPSISPATDTFDKKESAGRGMPAADTPDKNRSAGMNMPAADTPDKNKFAGRGMPAADTSDKNRSAGMNTPAIQPAANSTNENSSAKPGNTSILAAADASGESTSAKLGDPSVLAAANASGESASAAEIKSSSVTGEETTPPSGQATPYTPEAYPAASPQPGNPDSLQQMQPDVSNTRSQYTGSRLNGSKAQNTPAHTQNTMQNSRPYSNQLPPSASPTTAAINPRQNPWQWMWVNFPHMQPFPDGEIRDGIRIEQQDLSRLRQNGIGLATNRFILHAFQRYGHILLAELGEMHILAIPGIYDSQERFLANMFGFPYFKSTTEGPVQYGQNGYWYRPLH